MRINEIITETQVDEIDRRGFLKGMGAAAVSGAAGGANAAFSSEDIAGWFISTETSKFGEPTKRYALKNGFMFDGSNLYYSIGNGESSPWEMIKPGSVVKFIAGSGVQTLTANKYGMVNFTPYIKQLINTSKVDIRYTYSNRLRRTDGTSEHELDISGFGTVVEYFKNPQQYKKKDKPESEITIKSSEPSASYAGRIKARIMPNVTGQSAGPVAVEIRSSPDGTIISRKLVKSSGNTEWDQSVLKGIDRTDVLPIDIDGRVPSTITVNIGESVEQGVAEDK